MNVIKKVALAACVMVWGGVTIASADTLTVTLYNEYWETAEIEFYSQWDKTRAWPGDGEVFFLYPGESRTYRLDCEPGEEIAYGAWPEGDQEWHWGVGRGTESCKECLYTCGYEYEKALVDNPELYGD